jgi:hypothetical protein
MNALRNLQTTHLFNTSNPAGINAMPLWLQISEFKIDSGCDRSYAVEAKSITRGSDM